MRSPRLFTLVVLAAAVTACRPSVKTPPESDFHLVEQNPANERAGQNVSPRDYQGRVSAWYFVHTS